MTKVKDLKSEERHLLSPQDRKALIPAVDIFGTTLITSAHTQRSTSIILGGKEIGYDQVVVAAGEHSSFKVGDWVHINVNTFPKSSKPGKHDKGNEVTIHPPLEKIGGTEYLYLTDRNIQWRIQDKTISNIIK